MPYTTLDIPSALTRICQPWVKKQEEAKKTMGGSRAIAGLQASCKVECEKEITRQMGIYNKEEGEYCSEIIRLHAESKALVEQISKGGDANALKQKCQQLEANAHTSNELAGALAAHQGFRANLWGDTTLAKLAVGEANAKAMHDQFVKDRAPMIAKVAELKDLKGKIQEFVKRGWDLAQAHASHGGTVDVPAMVKELTARQSEFSKVAESIPLRNQQLNTMQKFVIAMNTKKATKELAGIEYKRCSDYSKQTKLLRAEVKTLGITLETLEKRLGEAVKHPQVAPLLASMHKNYKIAEDGAGALARSQEAYDKKVEEAKKLFH